MKKRDAALKEPGDKSALREMRAAGPAAAAETAGGGQARKPRPVPARTPWEKGLSGAPDIPRIKKGKLLSFPFFIFERGPGCGSPEKFSLQDRGKQLFHRDAAARAKHEPHGQRECWMRAQNVRLSP